MKKTDKEIEVLYSRFLDGAYSEDDLQQLLDYFETQGRDSPLREAVVNALQSSEVVSQNTKVRAQKIIDETDRYLDVVIFSTDQSASYRSFVFYRILFAAFMLLCLSLSLWFALTRDEASPLIQLSDFGGEVLPGHKIAHLELSDGSRYNLDTKEEAIKVLNNQIYYMDGSTLTPALINSRATVHVPRGGEYKVLLADGSVVWINSDSKLVYPLSFADDMREVEVEGEAYFSVQPDRDRPFVVRSKGQQIQVLGTEFGLRAYASEAQQTTLVSGRIDVYMDGQQPISLNPGQQLSIYNNKQELHEVNVEAFIGWKNGMFIFHDMPLNAILPQLARWYDIEVPKDDIPEVRVFGEIHRNTKLSEVLALLETATDVRFRIEERRLLIKRE